MRLSPFANPLTFSPFSASERISSHIHLQLGGHHRPDDFKGIEVHPRDEIAIYTWRDATVREIHDLLAEVHPAARRRGARLGFAIVYPDRRGMTVLRPAAVLFTSRPGPDDSKSLAELGFEIGDFLDVAIH